MDLTTNYPAIEYYSYHIVYNGSAWTTQDTGVPAYMPITVAFDSAGNAYTAFYDQGALPYKIKIAKSAYSISGYVLDPYSSYLSGAVVSLAGTVATSLTISTNGTYSFDGLPRGANCTITPFKAGYTFAPAAVTIAGVAKDYTYQSFSGSYQTYKASGYVKSAGDVPMAGITVSLTGGVASSTTTSTGGYYEFLNIPQHSSVTVIPSKTGYTFSPVSGTSADLTSNLTTNFTGALGTYKISGNISTNLSGVTVYLTGATILTAVSNGSGNYEFTGLTGLTNYTLTTFKPAYSLSPTAATITGLSADTTRNFSGTLLNYSISGFVKDSLLSPLSGTTVSVTGSTNLAAATGADGSYTFSNLTGLGNYQLSTSAAHYSIAPAGITITALAANQFNQNFTGTFKTWRVRGHTWTGSSAQIAGVTVNCTGATTLGAVTDAFANYEFAELKEGGDYTFTPAKSGYTFTASSSTVSNLAANNDTVNFVGTQNTYTISGVVNPALDGAAINLTGSSITSTVSAGGGNYAFTGLARNGDYTVSANKSGYRITGTQTFTNLTADQTGTNFTAVTINNRINGYVMDGSGNGIPDITIQITGQMTSSVTTNNAGYYKIDTIDAGNYNLTPSHLHANFSYAPTSVTGLSVGPADDVVRNFTATRLSSETVYIVNRADTNTAISLITLNVTGGLTSSVPSTNTANITISIPKGVNCTVTPVRTGWTFSPPATVVNTDTYTGQIYLFGTAPGYYISGRVLDQDFVPISGAALTLTKNINLETSSAATDAGGNYVFSNVPGELNYYITATAAGHTFATNVVFITNLNANTSGKDFSGLKYFTVSGRILVGGSPVANEWVSARGDGGSGVGGDVNTNMQTLTDGSYSFNLPKGGTYDVGPSPSTYVFVPEIRNFANLSSDLSNQDFSATRVYSISGTVYESPSTPVSGATIWVNGVERTTNAGDGTYTLGGLTGSTTYTIGWRKAGLGFPTRTISIISSNKINEDFTGSSTLRTISGYVKNGSTPVSGISLQRRTEGVPGSVNVSTDAAGYYVFASVPPGQDYLIEPLTGASAYSPTKITVSNLIADFSNQNFNYLPLYQINGYIKDPGYNVVAGVTVNLTGATTTSTTNSTWEGWFNFMDLPEGLSYTITPVLGGFTFTPPAATVSSLSSNIAALDFTANTVYAVSGFVRTSFGVPVSGATVNLTGSTTAAASTDTGGHYVFILQPGTFSIAVSKTSYSTTAAQGVTLTAGNIDGKDFTANMVKYKISGNVKTSAGNPVTGTYMVVSGGATLTIPTNEEGYYEATLPSMTDYTIKPVKEGTVFVPEVRTHTALAANAANSNFTETRAQIIDNTIENTLTFTLSNLNLNLTIPAGAFGENLTVSATTLTLVPDSGQKNLLETRVGVEITLSNPSKTATKSITLSFQYNDTDMAGFDENKLDIGYYDDILGRWVVLKTTRDTIGNILIAVTLHFSKYAILQLVSAANLDNVVVFPNPYKPGSGGSFDASGVTFGGLTAGAKIKIFTISGQPVRELEETDNDGIFLWDAKNNSGENAASGVYFYLITDPAGNKKTGKFAVVR